MDNDINDIKISGCILTRNDSKFIKGCVEHIIPYVDEIVILDANEDNITKSIVENISEVSSIPIIYRRTCVSKNFAKDRNDLQSMASGDYVIHVDCDELFNQKFLKSMRKIINSYIDKNIIPILFRFPRINQPDRINYPDYQIRLLNKNYAKWTRKVHEIPEIVPIKKEELGTDICNLVTLDYPIIHLYKEKNQIQKRWKDILYNCNNNKKLLFISVFKKPSKVTLDSINRLYSFNQNIGEDYKLDINFSFIDIAGNETFNVLEEYCREGYILNIQLRSIEYKGEDNIDQTKSEYKNMAKIRNYAIEQSVSCFPLRDEDYILFTEDSIEFNENIVHNLIRDLEYYHADIIAPMIYTGKELYFYDITSYRLLNGARIDDIYPYNLDMEKPNEMSSVGSFYMMKYKVAKNIKYTGENDSEQVEFCNMARSIGFKIFVDPRLSVFYTW